MSYRRTNLKVGVRHSVSLGGTLYLPGDKLPDAGIAKIKESEFHGLCEREVLVPGEKDEDAIEPSLMTNDPPPPPVVPPEQKGTTVTSTPAPGEGDTAPVPGKHKWSFNPKELETRSLQDLNVMIAERNEAPCDTLEEAILYMSQDFGKP